MADIEALLELVNQIAKAMRDEGVIVKIDFDHRDGLVIFKYGEQAGLNETMCVINNNNMTVTGLDSSKLWLPDYSKLQSVNRKIVGIVQSKGYRVL